MTTDTEAWCVGLPFATERPLDLEELRRVRDLLATADRRIRSYRWLRRAYVAAAALTIAMMMTVPQEEPVGVALTAVAGVGVALVLAGPFGALGEILFGFHPVSRWGFAGGIAVAATGAWWSDTAVVVAALAIGFGGGAMLLLRTRELRRLARFVAAVRLDLGRGIAHRFEGDRVSAREDPHASGSLGELVRHRIDVLPTTGVVVAVDDEAPDVLWQAPIGHAAARAPGIDAPLRAWQHLDDPDVRFRQRHLQPPELAELRGHVRRAYRTIALAAAGLFACGMFVLASILQRLGHPPADALDLPGVAAMSAVVAVVTALNLLDVRALRRDLQDRGVVVLRARIGDQDDFVIAELLPHSELPWTDLGQPAWWRLTPTSLPSE